jgi:hypothetical protein
MKLLRHHHTTGRCHDGGSIGRLKIQHVMPMLREYWSSAVI